MKGHPRFPPITLQRDANAAISAQKCFELSDSPTPPKFASLNGKLWGLSFFVGLGAYAAFVCYSLLALVIAFSMIYVVISLIM